MMIFPALAGTALREEPAATRPVLSRFSIATDSRGVSLVEGEQASEPVASADARPGYFCRLRVMRRAGSRGADLRVREGPRCGHRRRGSSESAALEREIGEAERSCRSTRTRSPDAADALRQLGRRARSRRSTSGHRRHREAVREGRPSERDGLPQSFHVVHRC